MLINLTSFNIKKRSFHHGKICSLERIGPHEKNTLSIIFGSLLGDTHLEKRSLGIGSRFKFDISNKNVEYLSWLHKYFAIKGYSSLKKPILKTILTKEGKVFKFVSFNTYTFSSFNWIHDKFYLFDKSSNNFIKIIPHDIENFLTPLALAIWFMNDASKFNNSVILATNSFTLKEITSLCKVLYVKFNILASPHSGGVGKGLFIKILVGDMPQLKKIINPYIINSMKYKLGNHI